MSDRRNWTEKEVAWLRANAPGSQMSELLARFNRRFGVDVRLDQLNGTLKRRKIRLGRDTRFKKGCVSQFKGTKRPWVGGNTKFKKGHIPQNVLPAGSVVANGDGYLKMKVDGKRKWVFLHTAIFAGLHGPIPEGFCVIFGDKDKMNLSPSNLLLVSRKQLAVMAKHGLIYSDAELTKVGALVASVKMAKRRREKGMKGKGSDKKSYKTKKGANYGKGRSKG